MAKSTITRPVSNGNGLIPPAGARRLTRAAGDQIIKIRRTLTPDTPPTGLAEGELSAELASTPPKLWIGVPAAVHADERLLLVGDPTLPAGGAQYDVLTKASAADGDVGWSNALNLNSVTVSGTNSGYLFEDQTTAGQQWRLRANNGKAEFVAPTGQTRLIVGSPGELMRASIYSVPGIGQVVISRNVSAERNPGGVPTLHLIGADTYPNELVMEAFGNANGIAFRAYGGTNAAPTALLRNRYIGDLMFMGLASGSSGVYEQARISGFSSDDWTWVTGGGGNRGMSLIFEATAAGTFQRMSAMSLSGGLSMHAGTGSADNLLPDMGLGTINAAGYYINGETLASTILPTGGAQYAVLSKASATDHAVEWLGAGVRPNNNTVIGAGAFNLTSTANSNVAVGANALAASTNGNFNTAVGLNALTANTTGNFNVSIGMGSMSNNVSATQSVAVGAATLQRNTTGLGGNSAFGHGSLQNHSGVGNTGIGQNSLVGITAGTAGDDNTAIGRFSGSRYGAGSTSLTLVGTSTFVGAYTYALADDPSNETVIGNGTSISPVIGNGSDTITLGNTAVTALYTRAGLVLGNNPTGGAKGPGTINATGPIYVNDVEVGALPSGGAQYEVLSKASATAGDVEWRGAGVRPANSTAIGAGALAVSTSIIGLNTAIGASALAASGGGVNPRGNVAVGASALAASVQGSFSTAVGYQALVASLGERNTAIGENSLAGLVTGDRNTAIGDLSGQHFGSTGAAPLTIANDCIYIGYSGRAATDNVSNEIVIGSSVGTALTIGHGSDTITLGNADITALYTHAGLVLGDGPTGGAQGQGTINCTDGVYVNNVKLGGFAPSIAWTADTDPDGASFFVNNTGRTLNVAAISWIVEEENGSAATVTIVKAASLTPISGGTAIHGVPLNANAQVGEIQDIIPTLSVTLGIGERLGLQATGDWADSVASITVYLEP